MHDLKTILKTLALLDRYDGQFAKTSRETGIKVRTIRYWYNKRRDGVPLLSPRKGRRGKWTPEEKKAALDYYFAHGESVSRTIARLGYPSASTMKLWARSDPRDRKRHRKGKPPKRTSDEAKARAVADLAGRNGPAKEVADAYGVDRVTLYQWSKELSGKAPNPRKGKPKTKEELEAEIAGLESEKRRLEMENAILRKANEELKKEVGADYSNLSNREKAEVARALEKTFPTAALLREIRLGKSTYYYERRAMAKDKYAAIRPIARALFAENYRCYGYRRMKPLIEKAIGRPVSEKVVARIMREEGLSVYRPRRRRYSSYAGEISPSPENLLKRDFSADRPFSKCLTDITEFSLRDGKV